MTGFRWVTRGRLFSALVVAVVAIALVGADSFVRSLAESRLSEKASALVGSSVEATIEAPSALVAVLGDGWGTVRLRTDGARLDIAGRTMLTDVDATARGVVGMARSDQVCSESLSAVLATSWQQLTRITGVDLEAGPNGQLKVRATVDAMGEQVPVVLTGKPFIAADDQRLELLDASALLDGVDVPDDVLQGLLRKVLAKVQLPRHPGVRFTALEASPEGPRLVVQGTDVCIPRG